MECHCDSQESALRELDRLAPDAPFLALGQTVFWDEPMKAGVALAARRLGSSRRFVAGVHDTDYFAKLAHRTQDRGFRALPHNDTTTRDLWSAAGEFSALFGSETVVTRDLLHAHGAKVGRIATERPGRLDQITEAYGWRGIVSLNPGQRIVAEKRLGDLFPTLYATLEWAIDTTLESVTGEQAESARNAADRLLASVCDAWDRNPHVSLAEFYETLLPRMYELVSDEPLDLDATTTTKLLRFNTQTAQLARFDLLSLFLNPATHAAACQAYDEAVQGSQIYALDRFGVGAVPFDLVIPGVGRGTLRLGTRGGLVMVGDRPVGFSYRTKPATTLELAQVLERKFGPDCTLVGKAVALIGSLAREFVFVFHEGASAYMPICKAFHRRLAEAGMPLALNPVLRVRYEPWDTMASCCTWLRLPEPLRRPFGTDELCSPSFSKRWREVAEAQRVRLLELSHLRSPVDLIRYLNLTLGGSWSKLAEDYEANFAKLEAFSARLDALKLERRGLQRRLKDLVVQRVDLERRRGEHWRDRIFEKSPTEADLAERARLTAELESTLHAIHAAQSEIRASVHRQNEMVREPDIEQTRAHRRQMSMEAELMRAQLIREAVIASDGLAKAGHRPSAWWFSLVCPAGKWLRETLATARYSLEPLV